jgi:hypothetical protein
VRRFTSLALDSLLRLARQIDPPKPITALMFPDVGTLSKNSFFSLTLGSNAVEGQPGDNHSTGHLVW